MFYSEIPGKCIIKVIHDSCYKDEIKNSPKLGKLLKDKMQMLTSHPK